MSAVSFLRSLVNHQRRLSEAFDRKFLPEFMRIDGNRHFVDCFLPQFLDANKKVADVGGGRTPCFSISKKKSYTLHITGVDISAQELNSAEIGAYDEILVADICAHVGRPSFDLIVCQSLLEHVKDARAAICNMSDMLNPDGILLLFAPSRRALFARINQALPEQLKRKLLFAIFPESRKRQGFPAFYDNCTLLEIKKIAKAHNLKTVQEKAFWLSNYFSFFLPFHIMWRIWSVLDKAIFRDQAAETFCLALQKERKNTAER